MPKIKLQLRIILYLTTIILCAITIIQVIFFPEYEVIAVPFYIVTAVVLGISTFYFVKDIVYIKNIKIKPAIEKNAFTNRLSNDYRYRTVLFTYSSFVINLIFATMNGLYGYLYHSWWFITFAVYYVLLSVMRLSAIRIEKKNNRIKSTEKIKKSEWLIYRRCGILFVLLTIALAGSVILMVSKNNGKSYPGFLIFVVAIYTFYKIILSIINILKARKMQSPVISTIRHIGYVDALVSILLLQTAMFDSFGNGKNVDEKLMNGLTGTAACIMILVLGIYMIRKANIRL